ncbi:MAG TPA: folylpolyglutamate synthase/dihydrofolate synthase family protein [Bacillota bacterium]|nr:folylpolyglutamate synthase/dihydrofolate synthase family protein [Bacillota bacterium]
MQEDRIKLTSFFNRREKYGIKPGLDRIHKLLELINNPEKEIKAVHIAGTNGKGSTIQFMKRALIESGYNVGVFTSPSFNGLVGHIENNDTFIDERTFLNILQEIMPAIESLDSENNHPTSFEIITAVAFQYFKNHVDIVLVEAGMGGLEDTTNCFTPILSIITNIDYDHIGFLGETLEEIARHKAGIIKHSVPVVTGEKKTIPNVIIRQKAEEMKAELIETEKEVSIKVLEQNKELTTFDWSFRHVDQRITHHLLGAYQTDNCSLALTALVMLQDSLDLDWVKIKKAIKNVQIQGRFEEVLKEPSIIIDGAHNMAGVESFVNSVQLLNERKERKLLLAMFKDKDVEGALSRLEEVFQKMVVTTFDHERAAEADELLKMLTNAQAEKSRSWKQSIDELIENDEQAYITGSLHFITRVRDYILTNYK